MSNAPAKRPGNWTPVSRSSGRYLAPTLADPDVAVRVDAFMQRMQDDKAGSVKFLKQVGILNRSGKLSKNFGG